MEDSLEPYDCGYDYSIPAYVSLLSDSVETVHGVEYFVCEERPSAPNECEEMLKEIRWKGERPYDILFYGC